MSISDLSDGDLETLRRGVRLGLDAGHDDVDIHSDWILRKLEEFADDGDIPDDPDVLEAMRVVWTVGSEEDDRFGVATFDRILEALEEDAGGLTMRR